MKKINLSREEKTIEKNFDRYQPVSKETRKRFNKIIKGSRKSRPI
jgi:hypothetical protein